MFKDATECYQAIGGSLAKATSGEWSKIVAEISLDGLEVGAKVSYWRESENAPAGYMAGVPMLARNFYELARLVSSEEKGFFKKCTFTLFSNGKYNADFVY